MTATTRQGIELLKLCNNGSGISSQISFQCIFLHYCWAPRHIEQIRRSSRESTQGGQQLPSHCLWTIGGTRTLWEKLWSSSIHFRDEGLCNHYTNPLACKHATKGRYIWNMYDDHPAYRSIKSRITFSASSKIFLGRPGYLLFSWVPRSI